jgi:aspartyl-tRNA(Asn)/glutamyl-tRNA(Gln) amidotransferase subunit B
MGEYEPIIGLEVHAELLTQSKMFCGCAVVDSTISPPNSSVCEICTGMPGTLPVINRKAVEFALRVALALQCEVAETSVFARKNYFYPDLPKGYQISQYELPLAENGWLDIEVDHTVKKVRIRRVHLEEDTGKLVHQSSRSLVDFNRSGVPLLEIVSEPDLTSVDEVRAYATALRSLLRYLGVNSGDMEKGVIRFEANVSVRETGSNELKTRTEIKNLNSFRAMMRAIDFEIERQSEMLRQGLPVIQETLGWDEALSKTIPQRSKEEAHDYRYFPEPDLPPLFVDPSWIVEIRKELPELPDEKRRRLVQAYSLSSYTAKILTEDRAVADFFEAATKAAPDIAPQKIANWMSGDLFGILHEDNLLLEDSLVAPSALANLVTMVEEGEINASTGKQVLEKMVHSGEMPEDIVETGDLAMVKDPATVRTLVVQVIDENPQQLDTYLAGKSGVADWFFGQVMRASRGKADPALVRKVLYDELRNKEESRRAGG